MNRWHRLLLCAGCGSWVAVHLVLLWTTHHDLVCELTTRLGCFFARAFLDGIFWSGGWLVLPLAVLTTWAWHMGLRLSTRARRSRPDGMASCAMVLGMLGISGLGIGLWLVWGSRAFSRHGTDDVVTQVALLIGAVSMILLAWGVWCQRRWARVGAVPALLWPLAAAVSLSGDAAGPLVLLFYALPFFGVALYFSAGAADTHRVRRSRPAPQSNRP